MLYPEIEPYHKGTLAVSDLHTLYWEESGNPDGIPLLFLHGGPGTGGSPKQRQFFDPTHFRIIIMDQRGAGRSRPLGETRENTTELLVSDLEALRHMLGIQRWHVWGGSWGSTLALAYAQHHPDVCLSLSLRGIFLMRLSEINWFLYGMREIFPEAWDEFVKDIPVSEHADLLEAYYRRLTHPDPKIYEPAARSWALYEWKCCSLVTIWDQQPEWEDAQLISLAKISCHYFRNQRFDPDYALLKGIDAIRHIPTQILQGRYDIVCPYITAYELHQTWPEAEFKVLDEAGHWPYERQMCAALMMRADHLRDHNLLQKCNR